MAVGANCGLGPTESVLSLLAMREVMSADAVLVAKANCGVPEFRDSAFRFTGTPGLMARYACLARIIGGCCGSDGAVIQVLGPLAAGRSTTSPALRMHEVFRRQRRRPGYKIVK